MSSFPWSDVLIIAGLILLNGLFSMSELAIVSARTARLKIAAEEGSSGAATALRLAADPGKFLSSVQIGITLVGIIAGAFSGSRLGGPVGERLELAGLSHRYADQAGFALVIVLTTYFSLVIGELVPKQLALRAAEPIAKVAARPMVIVAMVTAPFVWLLDNSSSLIMRAFGFAKGGENLLTAEELQMIFAEATRHGVIEEGERAIMSGIMRLSDRPVREVMTPRTEVDFIECRATEAEIRAAMIASPHSLIPIADGSIDKVVGVAKVRDIQAVLLRGRKVQITRLMKKPVIVPDQLDAMDALRVLQTADVAMALVHDEYGHLEGIVTPADLLSSIAGEFVSDIEEDGDPAVVEREDGSLLVSGWWAADLLAERIGLTLPDARDYATVAGLALAEMKRLPKIGEHFDFGGHRFEIVDMDGRKIDKLLVSDI